MNSVTLGKEIPSNKAMDFTIRRMHEEGGNHYSILIKASREPLLTINRIRVFSAVQIFKIQEGHEIEVNHELFQEVLTERDAETAIQNITSDFKRYVKEDGKEINNKTKQQD